jgi:chemotaxis protein methyltransferase CheR
MLKKEIELTKQDFNFIIDVVKKNVGIVLTDQKRDMVYRRLSKRVHELNLKDFSQYCEILKTNNDELLNLANAITTNLTSFFREKHHFDHLKEHLKNHIEKKSTLRIWSAGCSNGCEPYSIAMVLDSILDKRSYDAKILATDIDSEMLKKGISASYEMNWEQKIPADYKKCYSVVDDNIQILDRVRKYVHFKRLNLLEKWPMSKKFDLIFCRNTVIYFDKETQRVLFDKFANQLENDGLIYIGHSENLSKVCDRFKTIGQTIYRKIK